MQLAPVQLAVLTAGFSYSTPQLTTLNFMLRIVIFERKNFIVQGVFEICDLGNSGLNGVSTLID